MTTKTYACNIDTKISNAINGKTQNRPGNTNSHQVGTRINTHPQKKVIMIFNKT